MNDQGRYDSLFRYFAPPTIPWTWLKAQAIAESALDKKAVSPVGAVGLTQFMPATWKEWGKGGNPCDPEDSIRTQAAYMAWLERQLGDREKATAAYNAGIGRIRRLGDNWRDTMPQETKDYLRRIKNIHAQLEVENAGSHTQPQEGET